MTGVAMLFDPYRARAVLTISERSGMLVPDLDLDVTGEMGRPLRFEDLVKTLFANVEVPEELAISKFGIGEFQGAALRARFDGDYIINFGTQIVCRDLELQIGNGTGSMTGTADLGFGDVDLEARLPGERFELGGKIESFNALVSVLKVMHEPIA
ncbi:MAG: hypothetical protein IT331_03095 [Anaerolineae bacterium]|nr:hypothetical protein [Anaerolineae bacterium]